MSLIKKFFYDVDTQNDFMNVEGALYVPKADEIKPNLKKLTEYALQHNLTILGSVDKHFGTEEYKDAELELSKWGGPFPNHCMVNTFGQEKIEETKVDHVAFIKSEDDRTLTFNGYPQQIIFEKQSYDVFYSDTNKGGNQNIDDILVFLNIKSVVVYGVATDYCIRAATIGMLKRDIKVFVVEDAIKAVNVNSNDGLNAINEMIKTGAILVKTDDVVKL